MNALCLRPLYAEAAFHGKSAAVEFHGRWLFHGTVDPRGSATWETRLSDRRRTESWESSRAMRHAVLEGPFRVALERGAASDAAALGVFAQLTAQVEHNCVLGYPIVLATCPLWRRFVLSTIPLGLLLHLY